MVYWGVRGCLLLCLTSVQRFKSSELTKGTIGSVLLVTLACNCALLWRNEGPLVEKVHAVETFGKSRKEPSGFLLLLSFSCCLNSRVSKPVLSMPKM